MMFLIFSSFWFIPYTCFMSLLCPSLKKKNEVLLETLKTRTHNLWMVYECQVRNLERCFRI